eukprot:CAMPEP_0174840716 /NCGR_PEP_ID=MMETSP1114-20130205/8853_1 /TAXON_ID=312471 /ORGANISM="Neobodo designis, Strain CCAP 1951/1" /LENGTH=102 /DNA_ID=CAMNT_0016074877 /DNA_START=36 /DNA_END=344 /DNA_ORIENTATION=+
MDRNLLAKAVAASREGKSLAACHDDAPGTSHAMWAADEVAYLNALQPPDATPISMAGTSLKPTAYAPPGTHCPFNLLPTDAVATANAARSNAPLVRVVPGGA